MPMQKPEEHGAGDVANKYCTYCAPDGNLKRREEVRAGWINVAMKMENITREEAEKKVDEAMAKMPVWKN